MNNVYYLVINDISILYKFIDNFIMYLDEHKIKEYTRDDLRMIVLKELVSIGYLLAPNLLLNTRNMSEEEVIDYAILDTDVILHRMDKLSILFGNKEYIGGIESELILALRHLLYNIYNGYKINVSQDGSAIHCIHDIAIVNVVWPHQLTLRVSYGIDIPF